jgi:hypothetical protein
LMQKEEMAVGFPFSSHLNPRIGCELESFLMSRDREAMQSSSDQTIRPRAAERTMDGPS